MATTDLLDEYVLNETGCVYRGNAWTRGAKEWNFGQVNSEKLVQMYMLYFISILRNRRCSKRKVINNA